MCMMRKKFGQVLLEQGLITPAQLADALTYQGRNGMRLGQALVARGHITEDQLVAALGQALSTPVVDLARVKPDAAALEMVRSGFASEHDLFPIALRVVGGRKHLTVALADPLNLRGLDELGFITNAQIEPVLAKSSAIDMAIRRHYGTRSYGPEPGTNLPREGGDAEMTILRSGGREVRVHTGLRPRANDEAVELGRPTASEDAVRAHLVGAGAAPIPLTQLKRSGGTEFDAELGALIEAAGDAVQDEAIARLERRFWALMRVLAKKGLVNNDEFLRELNEEEATWQQR